ncbi:MAG: hypothetical protein JW724_03520 [Candidatus Altiarchaeota archaeon]|nr:hypothetical protein [Candidatus Altiarchaeota archaeon]
MDKENLTKELERALAKKDPYMLRELSNRCSDLAFITQDRDVVKAGVISYAFHKIFLKAHYHSKFRDLLSSAQKKLESGDLDGILADLKEFDMKHGFFQGNIVKKGRIKMGARLYTKGLSLATSADLVSVRISDILKYSGGTQVHDKAKASVRERLETARSLFR